MELLASNLTHADRPAEVELLHGMPTRADTELGWKRKVNFDELVREMVEADLKVRAGA